MQPYNNVEMMKLPYFISCFVFLPYLDLFTRGEMLLILQALPEEEKKNRQKKQNHPQPPVSLWSPVLLQPEPHATEGVCRASLSVSRGGYRR